MNTRYILLEDLCMQYYNLTCFLMHTRNLAVHRKGSKLIESCTELWFCSNFSG
jgi:hypothetical protein